MQWTPMNQSNVAALLVRAHEKAVLDFKKEYDLSDLDKKDTRFEIAKDIAAFANHLGGTIVVGAVENANGRICRFNSVSDAKGLVKAIDQASEFCLPIPVATHEELELDAQNQNEILGDSLAVDSVILVAINVRPYLSGPVGAKIWKEKGSKGQSISDAFRFPYRGVEGTRFLRPEELALAMNSHERRILLQLAGVQGQALTVWTPLPTHPNMSRPTRCVLRIIDYEGSVILLESADLTPVCKCEIPVALIRALWRTSVGWNMTVEGSMLMQGYNQWTDFSPSIV